VTHPVLRGEGALVATADNVDTLPAGGHERACFGIVWSEDEQEPITFFLDEVVIDTSPVGCGT